MGIPSNLDNERLEVQKLRFFLGLVGSKWIACILYELADGTKRYGEVHKSIIGIRQKSLTAALRKMERDGLIYRVIHPVIPPKVEYGLTPFGIEVVELVTKLGAWVDKRSSTVANAQKSYDNIEDCFPFWMHPKDPRTPFGALEA